MSRALTKILIGTAFLTQLALSGKAIHEINKEYTSILKPLKSIGYATLGSFAAMGVLYGAKKYDEKTNGGREFFNN